MAHVLSPGRLWHSDNLADGPFGPWSLVVFLLWRAVMSINYLVHLSALDPEWLHAHLQHPKQLYTGPKNNPNWPSSLVLMGKDVSTRLDAIVQWRLFLWGSSTATESHLLFLGRALGPEEDDACLAAMAAAAAAADATELGTDPDGPEPVKMTPSIPTPWLEVVEVDPGTNCSCDLACCCTANRSAACFWASARIKLFTRIEKKKRELVRVLFCPCDPLINKLKNLIPQRLQLDAVSRYKK